MPNRFSEKEAEKLAKLYARAEKDILREYLYALNRDNQIEYLEAMLNNVSVIRKGLLEGGRDWCEEAIPRVYSYGLEEANAQLKAISANYMGGYGAIHQQAVKVLADNAFSRLKDVDNVIGRTTDDLFRRMALEAVRGSAIGYNSWGQVARILERKLADKGVTGFIDRSGRKWNMKTYTRMVARTTTMEAQLGGTANRLIENGYDIVRISAHSKPCNMCKPFEHKLVSLTGKDVNESGVWGTLDEAREKGLFHPNCEHSYGLYLDTKKRIQEFERELAPL